jgi:hypothetical protein
VSASISGRLASIVAVSNSGDVENTPLVIETSVVLSISFLRLVFLVVPQRFEQEYKYLCLPRLLSQLMGITTSFAARRSLDNTSQVHETVMNEFH